MVTVFGRKQQKRESVTKTSPKAGQNQRNPMKSDEEQDGPNPMVAKRIC